MEKDPVDKDAGVESKPKLTLKQSRFAAAYVDPAAANGNGTLAARIAGYKGNDNQLAAQASANLRNAKIREAIDGPLLDMAPHAMTRLREGMDATKRKSFLNKAGVVVTTDPEPDYKTREKYVATWFKMLSKCSVDVSEQVGEDDAIQGKELSAADRVLLGHAAEIEAELAEIERKKADHDGTHATDHKVEQRSCTMPVAMEAEATEIDHQPAVSMEPEPAEIDHQPANPDAGHGAGHEGEQRSSAAPQGDSDSVSRPQENAAVGGQGSSEQSEPLHEWIDS